jgi:hypothetical protein
MNWLDSYYDAVEFFYWEPQHMRSNTQADKELEGLSKFVNVRNHLRKMEVTLNHNINQFFLLAPMSLRNDLFRQVFPQAAFGSSFTMHSREVDTEFTLKSCMQPDFLFLSDAESVSIEMKIASKCSVEQVLKYGLLGLSAETKQAKELGHYFILLGSGAFAKQWQERFATVADLIGEIAHFDLEAFLLKQPQHFRRHKERFGQILKEMHIEFLSYSGFTEFLQSVAPPPSDNSLGAEVYRNLIFGLTDEFKRRKLC